MLNETDENQQIAQSWSRIKIGDNFRNVFKVYILAPEPSSYVINVLILEFESTLHTKESKVFTIPFVERPWRRLSSNLIKIFLW